MLMHMTVNNFVSLLSSDAPAPGGGSVAALNGVLGAALIAKVYRLSIGRKDFGQHEDELLAMLEKADMIRSELSRLVDRDTEAFNKVMNAFKMAKTTSIETTTRYTAIQFAFREATEVPLEVARLCISLLELPLTLFSKSNINTVCDLRVSVICAYSGLIGAIMNVNANIPSVNDEVYTSKILAEVKDMRKKADYLKAEIDKCEIITT